MNEMHEKAASLLLLAGLALNASEAAAQGTWETKPPVPQASYGLGAAFLDGKLYAISGFATNRVAAFDTTTNTWAPRAPLPGPLIQYAGTAVLNGRIYVAGGDTGGGGWLATLWAYDPASNTWQQKRSMSGPRWGLGAAAINGKLYAVGGSNGGYLGTLEIYDPVTDQWTLGSPMPTPRNVIGVGAANGLLYVAGGSNGSGALDVLEIYDPSSDYWFPGSSLPSPSNSAVTAIGTKLYAVGGGSAPENNVLVYDTGADRWRSERPMSTGRHDLGLAADLTGRKLYAVGGYRGGAGTLDTLEVFTPATQGTWQVSAGVPQSSYGLGAAVVNGQLYAISGFATNRVAAFDPSTNTWSSKAPLPIGLIQYAGTAVIDGRIYVAGGDTGGGGSLSTLFVYDPGTNAWSQRRSMSRPRYGVAAAAIDGRLYVVGGYDTGFSSTLEVYDPGTDSWSLRSPMPTPRVLNGAAAVNGLLFVAGGASSAGALDVLEIYDPVSDSWFSGSSLPYPAHSNVAGIDQRIYLLGGGNAAENSVLVYDTLLDLWTADAPMPTGRHDLGVASDPSRFRVYAVGGYRGGAGTLGALELFTTAP